MKHHRTYKRFHKMIERHLGIQGIGEKIVFTVIEGDPEYNPTTGEIEENVSTFVSTAVRMDIKNRLFGDDTLITDDVEFYTPATTLDGCPLPLLTTLDSAEFAGSKYTITRSSPWDFAGKTLGYKIRAKVAS